MRYLDSGSRDPADTLYTWLDEVLRDATYFGCQTGYFSYDGIFPLEAHFVNLLNRPGALRLVVGANESSISKADLEDVLDLFDRAPSNHAKSLVVAAADDVLMHPKTFYVEKADGSKHALIGSANLTHSGLSRNIEAGLAVDSNTDPSAPFPAIRTAIERWHLAPGANAHRVTKTVLARLLADGVLDQPRVPRVPQTSQSSRNRTRTFPGMGAIVRLPRKRRAVAPPAPVRRPAAALTPPIGTLDTLPNGAAGILKRLSARDTSGFRGQTGTAHISMPYALANHLPMVPSGVNQEPRTEVVVEARLDTVPNELVNSGTSTTNIQFHGMGTSGTSNKDLRFNYLTAVKRGIENLAATHGVPAPQEGNLVAIEFLAGVRLRATFITEPASIAALTPLLDEHVNVWGWLPPGVISRWATDEDDA